MKTKFLLFGLMFIVFLATSCKKDDIEPAVIQKPQTMNELVASPTFNWKTTKDYQFTITGKHDAVVKVLSSNGVVYYKGFIKANIAYNFSLTLPSYENAVRINYFGKTIECNLSQTKINQTFNN